MTLLATTPEIVEDTNVIQSKSLEYVIGQSTKAEVVDIETRVESVTTTYFLGDPDAFALDALLVDDFGFDEFDIVEWAFEMEDEFDISIPDEAVEAMQTPQDMVNYIKEALSP